MILCCFTGHSSLTCELSLFGRHFASGLYHRHRPKVAIGYAHQEGEETRPGGVGQDGCAARVHAHDEERDEDHSKAGEEEQTASGPVVWERCQDLRKSREIFDRCCWG